MSRATCSTGGPPRWAMISDIRRVSDSTSRSWISMSDGAPGCRRTLVDHDAGLGRAKRFPVAPPERIMAAADIPMPTQMVDTSGSRAA